MTTTKRRSAKRKTTKRRRTSLFGTVAGVKKRKTATKRKKHVKKQGKSFQLIAKQKRNLPAGLQKAILKYHRGA